MAVLKHYHHHYHFSYTTSLKRHFSSFGSVLVILVIVLLFIFHYLSPSKPLLNLDQISLTDLISAALSTFYRLLIAYFIALVCAVPLAIFITKNSNLEKILLPFFDIVQSIPVLAFFPIIVLLFIKINFFEGAAIFILFMSMLWNMVFSMIGGLKTIPTDIESVAKIFHTTGLKKLVYITLPAIFPYITTGSLLAWAQGWNILIVAEVLHNYIPNGSPSQDLFGLGALMVSASAQGKNSVFLASIVLMIIIIGFLNFFVWQKLLHLSERYKFD